MEVESQNVETINPENVLLPKKVSWWGKFTTTRKAFLISAVFAILLAITLYILGCVFYKTDPTPNTAAANEQSNAKGGDANMNFVVPGIVSTLYAVVVIIIHLCNPHE